MAVSQIEEKILGRLARDAAPTNPLLSQSLYQILGLSILLSRKLYQARRVRKLDISRDTRSLQLYHSIIWLAREGLSITEVYILPECGNGESGPDCQVMAAKLRASLYHIFCLFHNHPPVHQLSPASAKSSSSSPDSKTTKNGRSSKSPKSERSENRRRRRASKNALRDPIPSMNSETSYVTNPYARPGDLGTPPPLPGRPEQMRTPSKPPGLEHIDISPAQAAAAFLLPPLNFVPIAKEYFEAAQRLADRFLSAANGLRLSVSLEHSAFMWDCEKQHDKARSLARQTIRNVYASTEGLDDDEFADASALVQALGGLVRRGTDRVRPHQPITTGAALLPGQSPSAMPILPQNINRTIPPVPAPTGTRRSRIPSPSQQRSFTRTPERLSTVQEDPSQETSETAPTTLSPPASRVSDRSRSRGKLRRHSSDSTASEDKVAKRRAVEEAEETYRRTASSATRNRAGSAASASASNTERAMTDSSALPVMDSGVEATSDRERLGSDGGGSRAHSRQNTPPDGSRRIAAAAVLNSSSTSSQSLPRVAPPSREESPQLQEIDQRRAVLEALRAISSVQKRLARSGGVNHGGYGMTR